MTKPGPLSASLMSILSLALAGAVVAFGLGRQSPADGMNAVGNTALANDLPAHPRLAVPPSTIMHPPIICRQEGCAEIKPEVL